MKLRYYQINVLNELRDSIKKGAKAPLLVLPTGSGKTVIFSELAKELVSLNKKVLIVVHRRELVKQACQKLDFINQTYGIIASGFKPDIEKNLQVASVYTLFRKVVSEKDFFIPDIIIFDEAHHVAAGTWIKIIERYKEAVKVGVTATPIRKDGKPLGKFFDKLIQGVQVEELVSNNYLCEHKVFAGTQIPDLSNLKVRRGDYQAKDLEKIMDKPIIIGDAVQQYKKHLLGKPAIAFCVDIAHAKKVHKKFIEKNINAELLTGEMSMQDRDQVLNNLKNNKTQVVISVDVISEGTDLPCVSGAILLRPTQSKALYIQQVGRVLRPEKNKVAVVLDHVGNTYRHDFIDIRRNWKLNFDVEQEKKIGKSIYITCKNCNFIFKQQKACPNCGLELTKKELITIEGELKELKRHENNQPITITEGYKKSKYAKQSFNNKTKTTLTKLLDTKKIINNRYVSVKKYGETLNVFIGDNLVFYAGQNKQEYCIVLAIFNERLHNRHTFTKFIVLTANGVEILGDVWRTTAPNFKHGEKVRDKIRSFKNDKNLLDNFITLARNANFKTGYNTDWIYRNYFAHKLIKYLKKYQEAEDLYMNKRQQLKKIYQKQKSEVIPPYDDPLW